MREDMSSTPPVGASLIGILRSAGVDRHSLIRVTGPGGLPALLWLCRHDFEQVGYLKPGHGHPHEPADALMIAHTCDTPWLAHLLDCGPHVRDGGVLVFLTPLPATAKRDPIHEVLEAHGYAVERCLHGARRELHVARRGAALRRAA